MKSEFIIGADSGSEGVYTYYLMKKNFNKLEFIITKQVFDEKKFYKEVKTMSELFNATVLYEESDK